MSALIVILVLVVLLIEDHTVVAFLPVLVQQQPQQPVSLVLLSSSSSNENENDDATDEEEDANNEKEKKKKKTGLARIHQLMQQHNEENTDLGYNNNLLMQFHEQTQQEKIAGYVGSSTYVNTNVLWNLEWHDAFLANNLADFVPPLTDQLQILTLGETTEEKETTTTTDPDWNTTPDPDWNDPSNEEGTTSLVASTTTAAAAVEGSVTDDSALSTQQERVTPLLSSASSASASASSSSSSSSTVVPNRNIAEDNFFSAFGALFNPNIKNKETTTDNTKEAASASTTMELASYDCILDKGLMSTLLQAEQQEEEKMLALSTTTSTQQQQQDNDDYVLTESIDGNNDTADKDGTKGSDVVQRTRLPTASDTAMPTPSIPSNNSDTVDAEDGDATVRLRASTKLLYEATKRIREHGIYIVQSSPPLTETMKVYLTKLGDELGLQWEFDLDGISSVASSDSTDTYTDITTNTNDNTNNSSAVSVARKYYVEELPTVGKLSRSI